MGTRPWSDPNPGAQGGAAAAGERAARFLRTLEPFLLVVLALLLLGVPGAGDSTLAFLADPAGDLRESLAEVHFIDVGEGDAILIRSGDTAGLIDGGDDWAGERVVAYLKRQGVTGLEFVMATHPHSDHVGGLAQVLRSLPVRQVYDSGTAYSGLAYKEFLRAVADTRVPYQSVGMGESLTLGSAVGLRVLAPFEVPELGVPDTANDRSVVVRLEAGGVTFLFLGDLEARGETRLMRLAGDLAATVVKVAKHGDRTASSALFLEQVAPRVAVITAGPYNEAGHPHAEVLERLTTLGVRVYRTDRHGTVTLRTDGRNLVVETESGVATGRKIYLPEERLSR